MAIIQQVKCRRCGATFSSLRSRCPNCGTRRVAQSTRSPGTTPGTVKGTQAREEAAANTRWQILFGGILVVAVILAVVVMVTSSLDGMDAGVVRATPTPMATAEQAAPEVLAAPTPSPTPEPTADSIKILYMNTKDLTDEANWPTMRVGESISINAVVYPMDQSFDVTWDISDPTGEFLQMVVEEDNSVTLTCVAPVSGGVTVTANAGGISQSIKIYCREAAT